VHVDQRRRSEFGFVRSEVRRRRSTSTTIVVSSDRVVERFVRSGSRFDRARRSSSSTRSATFRAISTRSAFRRSRSGSPSTRRGRFDESFVVSSRRSPSFGSSHRSSVPSIADRSSVAFRPFDVRSSTIRFVSVVRERERFLGVLVSSVEMSIDSSRIESSVARSRVRTRRIAFASVGASILDRSRRCAFVVSSNFRDSRIGCVDDRSSSFFISFVPKPIAIDAYGVVVVSKDLGDRAIAIDRVDRAFAGQVRSFDSSSKFRDDDSISDGSSRRFGRRDRFVASSIRSDFRFRSISIESCSPSRSTSSIASDRSSRVAIDANDSSTSFGMFARSFSATSSSRSSARRSLVVDASTEPSRIDSRTNRSRRSSFGESIRSSIRVRSVVDRSSFVVVVERRRSFVVPSSSLSRSSIDRSVDSSKSTRFGRARRFSCRIRDVDRRSIDDESTRHVRSIVASRRFRAIVGRRRRIGAIAIPIATFVASKIDRPVARSIAERIVDSRSRVVDAESAIRTISAAVFDVEASIVDVPSFRRGRRRSFVSVRSSIRAESIGVRCFAPDACLISSDSIRSSTIERRTSRRDRPIADRSRAVRVFDFRRSSSTIDRSSISSTIPFVRDRFRTISTSFVPVSSSTGAISTRASKSSDSFRDRRRRFDDDANRSRTFVDFVVAFRRRGEFLRQKVRFDNDRDRRIRRAFDSKVRSSVRDRVDGSEFGRARSNRRRAVRRSGDRVASSRRLFRFERSSTAFVVDVDRRRVVRARFRSIARFRSDSFGRFLRSSRSSSVLNRHVVARPVVVVVGAFDRFDERRVRFLRRSIPVGTFDRTRDSRCDRRLRIERRVGFRRSDDRHRRIDRRSIVRTIRRRELDRIVDPTRVELRRVVVDRRSRRVRVRDSRSIDVRSRRFGWIDATTNPPRSSDRRFGRVSVSIAFVATIVRRARASRSRRRRSPFRRSFDRISDRFAAPRDVSADSNVFESSIRGRSIVVRRFFRLRPIRLFDRSTRRTIGFVVDRRRIVFAASVGPFGATPIRFGDRVAIGRYDVDRRCDRRRSGSIVDRCRVRFRRFVDRRSRDFDSSDVRSTTTRSFATTSIRRFDRRFVEVSCVGRAGNERFAIPATSSRSRTSSSRPSIADVAIDSSIVFREKFRRGSGSRVRSVSSSTSRRRSSGRDAVAVSDRPRISSFDRDSTLRRASRSKGREGSFRRSRVDGRLAIRSIASDAVEFGYSVGRRRSRFRIVIRFSPERFRSRTIGAIDAVRRRATDPRRIESPLIRFRSSSQFAIVRSFVRRNRRRVVL